MPTQNHTSTALGLNEASFWAPDFVDPDSAWLEHAPFAFWLMSVLRPRTLVELGTHGGYSYFALCQAVMKLGLGTVCHAVDTWKGDEHAGFYGEEVFARVRDYHDAHYAGFSRLIRSTFEEAREQFPDGSIDLLHIDGRHFYDDVKRDFALWRDKLSDQAVVLFHDTQVLERDFGVHQLWSELVPEFPSFEFRHGHGLGILGFGPRVPDDMTAFFESARDQAQADLVRSAYARLGAAITAVSRDQRLRPMNGRMLDFIEHRATRAVDKWSHYFPIYERFFARYIGQPVTFLEIGIQNGGSLDLWRDYLGPTAKIVGIDIDPRCAVLASDGYQVYIGDQADRAFLERVAASAGPFDVVLDDASHMPSETLASFESLFRHVKPGGLYVIEDLHVSYWEEYSGGARRPGTVIEYTKGLIDSLNAFHSRDASLVPDEFTRSIGGIHVFDSMVVLERELRDAVPSPVRRGTVRIIG